jgi:hypothetical protein
LRAARRAASGSRCRVAGPALQRQRVGGRQGRATRADGSFVADLSPARQIGLRYGVEWVTVPDRFATTTSIRKQQFAQPVTRSRKLEGMWWGDGGTYFVCSFARGANDNSQDYHDGQVWFFDPAAQTIELKIHFEYTPDDQDTDPDGPDNITVSPYGGVIVAEDGDGVNPSWARRRAGRRSSSRATSSTTANSPDRRSRRTTRRCSPASSRPATCSPSPARSSCSAHRR